MKRLLSTTMLTAAVLFAAPAFAEDVISMPNLSYRTGPFAATGIPLMNGQRDYVLMLNARDGGANGVKLGYEECETGYSTEKGVECYEKTKANAVVTQPWSTGITLQVLPKTNVDQRAILAPGYGFSPMSNGKVFKWAFNPPSSYWDGAQMILKHISGGNLDTLKGKKIALLHLDHPYGKEPLPLLESLGAKHGFSVLPIPVGLKEMQSQSAQWLQIRRENPDFVLMWGWGAMNGGAIVEAIKTKYPMNQFIGIWWAGHEGDLATAGPGAKGYRQISWNQSVPDAKVIADIKKFVLDAKLSDTPADQTNWVFYQRGIVISMMLVEAIKTAQAEFKTKVVNAEQVRWALENLNIDEAKLAELGMENMVVPFATTCADHTGHAGAWMLEWDGTKFVRASDLIKPDRDAIAPLEDAKGKEYADANQPWPLNEECKL